MTDADDLLFMRARYYIPSVGRFINKDPIGLAGGLNLYNYVGGNPINLMDPLGLDEVQLYFKWIRLTPFFHTGIKIESSKYGVRSWGFNPKKSSLGVFLGQNVSGEISINESYNWAITISKDSAFANRLFENLRSAETFSSPNYDLFFMDFNCYDWRDSQLRNAGY